MARIEVSRRKMLQLMGMASAGALLAACGQPTPEPTEPPTDEPDEAQPTPEPTEAPPEREQVEVTIMTLGWPPANWEDILGEFNNRVADAGLAATLNMILIDFGSMDKLKLSLESGEPVDMMFDAPWLNLNQNIGRGVYEPLDELLPELAPDAMAVRPEVMWQANSFDGKIMAIPLGAYHYQGRPWLVRKDLREEYGLDPIENYDDFENFLRTCIENDPNCFGLGTAANSAHWAKIMSFEDFDHSFRGITSPEMRFQYAVDNDGTCRNLLTERNEFLWTCVERIRSWVEKGLAPVDVLSDPAKYGGASNPNAAAGYNEEFSGRTLDWGELEMVIFWDKNKKKVNNFLQNNFQAIPKAAKQKERALEVWNLTQIKENYDLLGYGIEGVNWVAHGDDMKESLPDNVMSWWLWSWLWNPEHEREWVDQPDSAAWHKWAADAENFEPDVLLGFQIDTEPIFDQQAQFNAIRDEYWPGINAGVVDVDERWDEFVEKAGDLNQEIVDEIQKQIDEFLG